MLRCLSLLGMCRERQALHSCLEQIILEYPGMIDEDTVSYWRAEVAFKMTTGFATALLNSPNLLSRLCQRYFERYDKNRNGTLEFTEALRLVHELHLDLGVQTRLLTEQNLAVSMQRFNSSDNRDGLPLSDFSKWFTFALQNLLVPRTGCERQNSSNFTGSEMGDPDFRTALAVLNSPALFQGLCRRYFRKFDSNGNGRLELSEAIALARALHESLGLPAESLDEWQLLGSFGCEASLGFDDFPAWFAAALKSAAAKSQQG